MTVSKRARPVTKLAPVCVTKTEAARMLAMELSSFNRYVFPYIKVIRRGGSLVLVPVSELERWVKENADYTLVL
jgi:hypothetical protein